MSFNIADLSTCSGAGGSTGTNTAGGIISGLGMPLIDGTYFRIYPEQTIEPIGSQARETSDGLGATFNGAPRDSLVLVPIFAYSDVTISRVRTYLSNGGTDFSIGFYTTDASDPNNLMLSADGQATANSGFSGQYQEIALAQPITLTPGIWYFGRAQNNTTLYHRTDGYSLNNSDADYLWHRNNWEYFHVDPLINIDGPVPSSGFTPYGTHRARILYQDIGGILLPTIISKRTGWETTDSTPIFELGI